MSIATETFAAGDRVALVAPLPGRPKPAVGAHGVVLIGSADAPWSLLTVSFGNATRPWQVHPRHLRLVERAAAGAESGA